MTNYSRIPAVKLINCAELGNVSEETSAFPYWVREPPLLVAHGESQHAIFVSFLLAVVNT